MKIKKRKKRDKNKKRKKRFLHLCYYGCLLEMHKNCQRYADVYLRIDILWISVILTDMDRIRIVISLFEQLRVVGYGYFVADILRTYITSVFYFMFYFLLLFS